MSAELTKGIELAYRERTDLLVVALTGRTGSGCSTAAGVLCREIDQISLAVEELKDIEHRKMAIVHDFARAQWKPFRKITVSTVILSFVIQQSWAEIESFLSDKRIKQSHIDLTESIYKELTSDQRFTSFCECMEDPSKTKYGAAWKYFSELLEVKAVEIRQVLSTSYAPMFQTFGDNIRYSGNPLRSNIRPEEIFALIRRVKIIAKSAFYSERSEGEWSTKIVIDAIRNPLELVYLRDQFAAFYAIAITTDDDERIARLLNAGIPKKDIEAIDKKEYSKKPLSSYADFVSQNIKDCIQKSDLFFTNPGRSADFTESVVLNRQVILYVTLMLRPGLVTPTRDERCMQLAFVAKLNSGCISRQVGAAVADKNFSIKSVGWNDVPKGQISCLLRDVTDLLSKNDSVAFSDYEKTNKDLRDHIGVKFQNKNSLKVSDGLRCPFCFKDAYNELQKPAENNQVHTRSLHAEENAFLQLAKYGNSGIDGGILYTTASPCELCSKKAFQLGIGEIVFVDPYPGISAPHVLKSGLESARPSVRLFSGAVGHAYHRLYEAILPIKDEYAARLKGDPQVSLL